MKHSAPKSHRSANETRPTQTSRLKTEGKPSFVESHSYGSTRPRDSIGKERSRPDCQQEEFPFPSSDRGKIGSLLEVAGRKSDSWTVGGR